jgi:hypothetical protein
MIFGGFPIPMPKPFPANPMIEPAELRPPAVPRDLEARIAAFERAPPADDFDAASWFWMILLGVAIPLIMLAAGWWI